MISGLGRQWSFIVLLCALCSHAPAAVPPVINTNPGPEYSDEQRDFAMVIGLDRTPRGRLWAAWVAGGDSDKGYFVAASSDDDGATWSKPRLVIDPHDVDARAGLRRRTLVGNLWTDPTGRLWLFFDQSMGYFDGRAGAWAITCDNPDADRPAWSAPRRIWHGMTLNKPTVLKNGDWLMPISLWTRDRIKPAELRDGFPELDDQRMAHLFVSTDKGATWARRGGVVIPQSDFDEHMFVELKDGRLWMLARTKYGIAETFSSDGGRTWSEPKASAIQNPSARFFLRRLASGNLLLVKNGPLDKRTGRTQMTAFLSDDEGKSWRGGFVFEERNGVSYPDGFQSPEGVIHILYDRERAKEREILMAKFTEADVLAGKLVSPGSQTKMLVSKARGPLKTGSSRREEALIKPEKEVSLLTSAATSEKTRAAIELAHREIWRRFIDAHGVMLDFTELDGRVSIPTPEECRLGKPNALGWWSPIENGAFFNGLYMDAAVNRWRLTKSAEDAAKAKRLAEGLMFLASLSDVKGFIARGAATDGKSHYQMGSDDQTLPWFYGLWRYLDSGLATPDERRRIVAKLTETADAILALNWQMPAEPPFGVRGGFRGFLFYSAPRLLFVAKLMHQLTGDAKWDACYRTALDERGGTNNVSRLELCERGLVFEHGGRHAWTASCAVAALRALWEMETDERLRAAYARGLAASVKVAAECLPLAEQFNGDDPRAFDVDWRKMNADWKPQASEQEAVALAQAQLKEFGKLHSPRRGLETAFVREPVFAAWIITLCPDRASVESHRAAIERVLNHYRYDRLHYSQFFPAESAWYRLEQIGITAKH